MLPLRTISVVILVTSTLVLGQGKQRQLQPPTPPRTESKPLLLDSYLPACMQVIHHLADLMRYELRPPPSPKPPVVGAVTTSTTTTLRPTPHHKPGYYAPEVPPGQLAYYSRSDPYGAYLERFRNPQGLGGYFDGYVLQQHQQRVTGDDVWSMPSKTPIRNPNAAAGGASGDLYLSPKLPQDLDLFGITPSDLLHRVNRIDDYDFEDDDDKVERFVVNYDDVKSNFNQYLRAQRKVPPTRAYVTLLSLYDALNKEAKTLNFQKYGGYTEKIVKELAATSTGTAADQLKFVLTSYRPHANPRNAEVTKKIDALLPEFEKSDSYLNDALRDLPPLQFTA